MASSSDAQAFVARLLAAGSSLGRQLHDARDQCLLDYLAGLFPLRGAADDNRWLAYVARALELALADRGWAKSEREQLCSRFMERPVIQQADHSQLLLDAEVFLNNFLFALGARAAGVTEIITSQCSTVSCLSRRMPVGGPLYLRTRGHLLLVLRVSKRAQKNATFCALPGPVVMTMDRLEGVPRAWDRDPMIGPLIGRTAVSAPALYGAANDAIWRCLDQAPLTPRVGIDESTTSAIAALHLEDASSPLRRLIFDTQVRDCFLSAKRRLVAAPANLAVNRAPPDFFWYRKGARLTPVILSGTGTAATLRLETDGSELPIPYDARALAAALRTGDLYLDRIGAYFVRTLLPGVVAVGGTSQQDYVALYQRLFQECQAEQAFLDADDAARVARPDASRLGGAPLLELDRDQQALVADLGPATDLGALARSIQALPVGRTIGRLCAARYLERTLARAESGTAESGAA